jgi:SAM-dependent methyltransferase
LAAVESYADVNRTNWDERAPAHAASPDYGFERFLADPEHLSDVVRFDLPRLGDIRGLRGVHLQCHIGTDTLSLARLGAQMTGLDLSPKSLEHARSLSDQAGPPVQFVEAEVYDAVSVLGKERFEFVFTGIGALCWLPSVRRWAGVVSDLLAPAGRLFIREAHPMLWALDDTRADQLLVVEYPYRELDEPMVFNEEGTYVRTEAKFSHNTTHVWNHGLGEIASALLDAGMRLTMLMEHDRPWRVPHTYTLQAVKLSDGP